MVLVPAGFARCSAQKSCHTRGKPHRSTKLCINAKIMKSMKHNTKRMKSKKTDEASPHGHSADSASRVPRRFPADQRSSHWGHVGAWYDELIGQDGSDHHQKLIIPGVLRMLNLHAGDRLLDVACGQGVLGRAGAKLGVHTLGVDMAASLIAAAMERREDPALERYYQADARNLSACSAIKPGEFDAAACILAIANITPLSPVWHGIYSALKPMGKLVVVLLHPCFRIPKKSAWQWDAEKDIQHRLVDGYLTSEKIPIAMHPGSDPDATTLSFHRPLQAYINTLGSAGLWVDHMEEWVSGKLPPRGVRFAALDQSRREIPLFLALRAVKAR